MPFLGTSASLVMVERDTELTSLQHALAEAADGRRQVVLVKGEAGVGKSRLAREAMRQGVSGNFEIVVGTCSERDLAFPFAPFVDAFRQRLTSSSEDPTAFLGQQAAVLAELLPEYPNLAAPETPSFTLSPEQGKRRLFEGIVALFRRLAARQPLLLILEDLHWSDPTSLELLELLPRRLATSRLLVLGTFRDDEQSPALSRAIAALHRARSSIVLALDPLSEAGVGAMIGAMLPAPPHRALVSNVCARTGGNPFLIEETIALVVASGDWLLAAPDVPFTVRDMVQRQLEGLDNQALWTANLAAVAGERVEFDFLLSVSKRGRDELLATLHLLIGRRLLAEDQTSGRSTFVFRHALTRAALLDRLLLPERRSLHRLVAEALEASLSDPPLPEAMGEIGGHFHSAGEWRKTLDYAPGAGHAAWKVHANAEALTHYQRALVAAIALDDSSQAELHCRCGQALALLGAFERASEHLEQALSLANRRSDMEVAQEAVYALAGLFASRDYRKAEDYAQQAYRLARSRKVRIWEARTLNRLGNVFTNLMRFPEGRALHEDALAIVNSLDDARGSADTLDHIGMSHYLAGETPEARELFGQAAAIFTEVGDLERAASALSSRGMYLAVLDGACATDTSPEDYRLDAAEGLRLSQEIGWRAGEAYAFASLATADLGSARYGDAVRNGEAALAIAREIDHHQWEVIAHFTFGLLHAQILDDTRARFRFNDALLLARSLDSRQWIARLETWISRCDARLGMREAEPAWRVNHLQEGFAPGSIGQRRELLTHAEQDLEAGMVKSALSLTNRLLAGAAGPRSAESVLFRANVLSALSRKGEADASYLEARRLANTFGPRSLLWRVAAGCSQLWSGIDHELAQTEASEAGVKIDALASGIPNEEWRAVFLGAPEVRPWLTPARRHGARKTSAKCGLTDREQDVARCICRGMSNKEIANALSIAVKTVEMHVGRCLSKLGLSSRAQLAVWGVAEGLVSGTEGRADTGFES